MPILHVEQQPADERGEAPLKVIESVGLAPWEADAELDVVGTRQVRVEGAEKVSGRARYACDIRLPGQLYARVLRSPLPHARIQRIDTSRAEALPGVRAALSAANAPEIAWYQESRLFDRTVRFVGDEVAAVAADTEEIAEDALRLLDVEYEPLLFVGNLDAALRPDAPKLYANGNIAGEPQVYGRGDVEAGFRDADMVIEQVYTTQTALHNCLEPHGCTVAWEGDRLILYASTQSVFAVRKDVAEKLKLPEHHARVITQYMGGGFGSKQIAWKQDVIAALLARAAGRPVQLMLDREAENLAAGNRNATRQHVRLGAKRDGTLSAISTRIEVQAGAYMVGGEASDVSGIYQTLYRCANVRTEQVGVYTNTGPAVAFRAPGHVEGAFALESAMDELARALQIDPIEIRLRNYAEEDQRKAKPYTSPDSLRRCYERVADVFGWPKGETRDLRLEASEALPASNEAEQVPSLKPQASNSKRRAETAIGDDELLLSIHIPPLPKETRNTYLKAMDRKVWAFALVGVAAVLRMGKDQRIEDARLVLSGVAPIPWRAADAEQQLVGAAAGAELFAHAADVALAEASPLEHNAYKLPLARALIRRALAACAAETSAGD